LFTKRLRRRTDDDGDDVVECDAFVERNARVVVVVAIGLGDAKEARSARPSFTETTREERL
jgi:hypothetical protein